MWELSPLTGDWTRAPCIWQPGGVTTGPLGKSPASPHFGKSIPLCPSRASLVVQMVKNLPAMQETQVWSLGQEDPLEKGMATHSSILPWRIPWREKRSVVGSSPWGLIELDMTEQLLLPKSEKDWDLFWALLNWALFWAVGEKVGWHDGGGKKDGLRVAVESWVLAEGGLGGGLGLRCFTFNKPEEASNTRALAGSWCSSFVAGDVLSPVVSSWALLRMVMVRRKGLGDQGTGS